MYEITCEKCGRIGFHTSRIGANSRAETHSQGTDHDCAVAPMDDVPTDPQMDAEVREPSSE